LLFCSVGLLFGLYPGISGRTKGVAVYRRAMVVGLIALTVAVFPRQGRLYTAMHASPGSGWNTYVEESVHGVVLAHEQWPVVYNYINGLSHGARGFELSYGFYLESIEAISYTPRPQNVLVIGFGTGYVTETAESSDEVESITLVELNRGLLTNLKKIVPFRKMLADPRLNLVVDDGRRFLTQSDRKFDVILMDPLRSRTAYSNNLYSREFFQLLQQHLTPGGVVMVWLDELQVIPNTVLSVFGKVRMYDYFLLASDSSFRKDEQRALKLLHRFSAAEQAMILRRGHFVKGQDELRKDLQGFPVNRDLKPVSEFYLRAVLSGRPGP